MEGPRTGPLSSNVAETGAFYASRDDLALPDIQLHVAPTGFYDNGMHEPVRRALTTAVTLVNVQSSGHVRLRSADPTWHPEIDPGYFDDRADLEAMIGGFRTALEVLRQAPIARYVDEPWVPASSDPSDDDIIESIGRLGQTLYHPVGTCAMGTVEGSVVDPELRVHGVEGLRVADALRHAAGPARQHQRPHHHDRREVRRPPQGVEMSTIVEPTDTTSAQGAPRGHLRLPRPRHRRRRRDPRGQQPRRRRRRGGPSREAVEWWGNLSFDERPTSCSPGAA